MNGFPWRHSAHFTMRELSQLPLAMNWPSWVRSWAATALFQSFDHAPLQQVRPLVLHSLIASGAEQVDPGLPKGRANQRTDWPFILQSDKRVHFLRGGQRVLNALEFIDVHGCIESFA